MAKRKPPQQPEIVRRDGGLCVTFVNTASRKREGFAGYAELLAWSVRCGAVTATDAERLERAAAERPKDADEVFLRALQSRSWLQHILGALVARELPAAADLEALNAALAAVLGARRLVAADGGGWRWAWGDRGGDDLDRMLWPILTSAAALLASKHYRKVRRCAGEDCDLLFVDRTPGSPRKWCSMKACGSKVKALRHYRRTIKPEREAHQKRFRGLTVQETVQLLEDDARLLRSCRDPADGPRAEGARSRPPGFEEEPGADE